MSTIRQDERVRFMKLLWYKGINVKQIFVYGTLLQRSKKCVKIGKAETLLILRAYFNHPTNWADILQEVRQNLDRLSVEARELYETGSLRQLRDRMSTKLSGLLKQRPANIQDLEIRNAVDQIKQQERRLIPRNDNQEARGNAAALDARDVAAEHLLSDSGDDEANAPPLAPALPLAAQNDATQHVAGERPAPQPAAGLAILQPAAQQPAPAPQQPAPAPPVAIQQQAAAQPPLPNRRRRRISLAELIRENQMDYRNFIRNKIPKLLRELGVSDSE